MAGARKKPECHNFRIKPIPERKDKTKYTEYHQGSQTFGVVDFEHRHTNQFLNADRNGYSTKYGFEFHI